MKNLAPRGKVVALTILENVILALELCYGQSLEKFGGKG